MRTIDDTRRCGGAAAATAAYSHGGLANIRAIIPRHHGTVPSRLFSPMSDKSYLLRASAESVSSVSAPVPTREFEPKLYLDMQHRLAVH